MRSNQRPFARHNCRPRLLCPIVRRLRPAENLQNAFLNECEIVRAVRPSTSAGNFADPGICRRRYKFATNAATREMRERDESAFLSYFYIYREGRSFTGPWKEFRGNRARRTASSRWRKYCLAGHSVI